MFPNPPGLLRVEPHDTLLLTVPNQLGVVYNLPVIEAILSLCGSGPRLALTLTSLCKAF
jgi:hypothetical protein